MSVQDEYKDWFLRPMEPRTGRFAEFPAVYRLCMDRGKFLGIKRHDIEKEVYVCLQPRPDFISLVLRRGPASGVDCVDELVVDSSNMNALADESVRTDVTKLLSSNGINYYPVYFADTSKIGSTFRKEVVQREIKRVIDRLFLDTL